MTVLFAILSALLYAVANVYTKKGFEHTNTISAFIISIISCFVTSIVICVFLFSMDQFVNRAIWFFLAAGIIGPFLGRILLYEAIDRVGTSVACSIFEAKPFFSVIPAMIFLGERLTLPVLLGILFMMLGTVIIAREKDGGEIAKKWSHKDLLFPLSAGACYGGSHVLRKMGINILAEPFIAVMWQNVGAFMLAPALVYFYRPNQKLVLKNKNAWFIFSVAGVMQVAAQWCLFAALDLGTVVVVSPLTSLSTFFVLILAALFLRQVERVTWQMVLGAVLIVGATTILIYSL